MDLPHHASEERDYIAMRTLTVVRQYLAAAFLLVIGLGAYGCGDSATVNPEATLANLSVTTDTATITLDPVFNPATTSYTANLSNNVTTVTITAQPAVAGDTISIDGQTTTSTSIDLGQPVPTESTKLVNVVVSNPPSSSRAYTVLLKRAGLDGNNSLQTLAVSPGALAPTFNANTQTYTVDVANTAGSVTVTPTLQDTAATLTVNGQGTNSGQARTVTLNGPGQSTVIPIIVTAQNGTQKTYTVTVSRGVSSNSNLQGLTVSPGPLSPTYNANRASTSYTVNVGSTVTSITVTPTRQDPAATITVNGTPATSGQGRSITLNGAGSNTFINIVVTAQNGSQKLYTVEVSRAALGGNNNLSGLTVSPGPLNPAYDANRASTSYTVNVGSTVNSITVTPTLQTTTASMTVNGQATNSGQARTITPLNPAGQNTLITIQVTAQNTSQKTYTVNVNRAALGGNNNLSALTVSPGSLNSAFDPDDQTYSMNVASTVDSITVTPTLQATTASMTVNGQATNSGQARTITPLNPAGQNTLITIQVTAQNTSQKIYTVNVIRTALGGNDALQSLTVSPGTLSPAFSVARTLPYTVNDVSSSATSIFVTAAPQDPSANVTINDQGGNSRSIPLPTGPSSTEIEVRVIAPNGNDRTYLITVNQPAPSAPPAPTVAPDLTAEDDSCEPGIPDPAVCAPGTSREDNITNVSTPRFRISQPAAGQTPSLYVDGNKDGSAPFDPSANTLRPTAALSDGNHTITYTVTDTATNLESPQSPSLTVTIDTVAPGGQ
jgi:Cadherin-like beta sandwich domain/Bacterial Ig-like domain